ncbi:MAG: glutaredoxin-like protein NrdH [Erysipelotrichaceae bacterium]|nr:glutaredoxin-like protein NrdH [Erysipelotrichaceae bacterium]
MKKITVYSKSGCIQCNFTKKFLEEHNLEYTNKDVELSSVALKEVKELGFTSLPVIVIEGLKPFNGFRPDILEKLINE